MSTKSCRIGKVWNLSYTGIKFNNFNFYTKSDLGRTTRPRFSKSFKPCRIVTIFSKPCRIWKISKMRPWICFRGRNLWEIWKKLFNVLEDFLIFQILQCFENIFKTLQDQPSFETGLGDFPEPNFWTIRKFLKYLKEFEKWAGILSWSRKNSNDKKFEIFENFWKFKNFQILRGF